LTRRARRGPRTRSRLVDEVRLGGSWTSHDDDAGDDPVVFKSAYLETYWAIVRSRLLVLRVAPRLAWIQQSRAMYPKELSEFGFGGAVGARTRPHGRLTLEAAVGLTGITFNTSGSAFHDPDRIQPAWLWEFRLGTAFRLR